jgi:hypothetical protein
VNRYRYSIFLALIALLSACGRATGTNELSALHLAIALAGDQCGVVAGQATVSAPEMETIGPVELEVGQGSMKGQISNVPAGLARTVAVVARNARGLSVYEGSAKVDVVAGATAAASIVLVRNTANCPVAGTGSVDVAGTIQNEPPPSPGDVLSGAEFAFDFTDAVLTSDGILHFFDAASDRIRRLDLASRKKLPDLVGSADAVSMAVAPDGSAAYLGYTGGRIDAFDLATGTSKFFAAAPSTVSSMIVTDAYLFTVDDSGAWNTQSLFQRSTGARVASADWRNASRSMVYSPAQQTVYYLDSDVSPTDVRMQPINLKDGTLGADKDSPYHGDYNLPNPLRLLPDESGVIVGSGLIFNTADLTYRSSLGLTFTDIAFLKDKLYLIDPVGSTTQLRVLDSTFDILSAQYFSGTPKRAFAFGDKIVLVTQTASSLEIRFLAP